MLVAVVTGFGLALAAPLLVWAFKRASGAILALYPGFLFAYLLQFVPEAAQGRPWRFTLPWDAASGLEVSFRADALSLYFGLILALIAAAALAATAAPEIADAQRARLLVAVTALFSAALGFVFADQPVLLVTFAAAMSLAAFLAVTAGAGAEARLAPLWVLLAWLLADLLLLVLLARLFADVPGGLLGAGGISSLVPNGRPEPAWLTAIFALKLAPLFAAMASRRAAPLGPALAALSGLALPAMLCVLMRLSGLLPEAGRIALLALAGAGLLAAAAGGLGARRAQAALACLALAAFSAAAVEISLAGEGTHAAALLIAATAALGLSALYLLLPVSPELNLKNLRAQTAGTFLGASFAIAALLILAGLLPSTGFLALVSGANAAMETEPTLSVPASIFAFAVVMAIALRIGAVLAFGETGEAKPSLRAIALACAGPLLLVAAAAGCAPELAARLMIGPAVRTGYAPALLLPGPDAAFLIAGCLALAALLFWQRLLFAHLLRALAKRAPAGVRVPGATIALAARLSPRRFAAVPVLVASAALAAALVLAGAAAIAWPAAPPALKPADIAALALGLAALAGGALAIPQRKFVPAVPVVAIAGGLAVAGVLAAGAVELGFVMLLILLIQTLMLLFLSARDRPPHPPPAPRIAAPLRIAAALVAGAGMALLAVGAGAPEAQTVAAPAGITGLVGAAGLALREAGLTAIQRWSGVVLALLIVGAAVSDLNSRREGEA